MGIDVGTLLEGRYRILKQLGAGAMGAVFLAENIRIGRRVAIKVLHSHVSHTDGASTRFQQEARAATAAGSEHIIDILDFGDIPGGDLYMVMEYLEGESLKDRMAKGKMREADIVGIARQMLQGLGKAHAAGIVHRDLKPDNVFILKEYAGQRDWVKVLDFGICRLVGDEAEAEPSMTQTGMVLGTPHFMSPEHVKGSHHVTFKSDLYAVAAMMYRGLTGEVPFNGSNLTEIMYRIAYEPPPDHGVALTGVDARLVAVILKGMARDPAERYGSAEDFDRALGQLALLPGDMGESMSATRRTNPPPSALPTPSNPPGPMVDTNPAVAKSLPLVLGKTAIPAEQTTKDGEAPVAAAPSRRNGALIFAGAAFGIGSIAAAIVFTMMNKKPDTATAAKASDTVAMAASTSASASPPTADPASSQSRPTDPVASSKPDATTAQTSATPPNTSASPNPPPTNSQVAVTPTPSTPKPPPTTPTTHPTSIATDDPYK